MAGRPARVRPAEPWAPCARSSTRPQSISRARAGPRRTVARPTPRPADRAIRPARMAQTGRVERRIRARAAAGALIPGTALGRAGIRRIRPRRRLEPKGPKATRAQRRLRPTLLRSRPRRRARRAPAADRPTDRAHTFRLDHAGPGGRHPGRRERQVPAVDDRDLGADGQASEHQAGRPSICSARAGPGADRRSTPCPIGRPPTGVVRGAVSRKRLALGRSAASAEASIGR